MNDAMEMAAGERTEVCGKGIHLEMTSSRTEVAEIAYCFVLSYSPSKW
jgi:hypothetical protein